MTQKVQTNNLGEKAHKWIPDSTGRTQFISRTLVERKSGVYSSQASSTWDKGEPVAGVGGGDNAD